VYWENGKLNDVGILADGTLHNPRGYDPEVVRKAVLAANERKRVRRSEYARKAATRRSRWDKKVYQVAQQIVRAAMRLGRVQHALSVGAAWTIPSPSGAGLAVSAGRMFSLKLTSASPK